MSRKEEETGKLTAFLPSFSFFSKGIAHPAMLVVDESNNEKTRDVRIGLQTPKKKE